MSKAVAYLHDVGVVCALGSGKEQVLKAALEGKSQGMLKTSVYSADGVERVLGQVLQALPELPASTPLRQLSRNNRLALAALEQIRPGIDELLQRFGPGRIGVVIGTTTSGISEGEGAIGQWVSQSDLPAGHHYGQIEIGSPAEFISTHLGLRGPSLVVSTACSSSAKAMAMARRLLRLGVCDAVIAGGVDTLCRYTVAGFHALGAVSAELCQPFSKNRAGINIGEAAALFIVTREPAPIALLGCGESSDAYNISAPLPEGEGAEAAMRQALADAGLTPDGIDYINLHGTATDQNDSTEAKAVHRVFPGAPHASSSKALTGHTLGAAGALEAALCFLLLADGDPQGRFIPQAHGQPDPELPRLNFAHVTCKIDRPLRTALSNSFGFGGSNASLVLGRVS